MNTPLFLYHALRRKIGLTAKSYAPEPSSSHLLEIDSVQFSYGYRKILKGVYLRCETGKVVGILGRNGCGKTTLLKMMYGEISKGEKVLRIDKKALLSNHRNPRVMRILPHYHFIPPHFTLRRIFDDYKLDFQEFVGHFPEMAKLADTKIGACSGGGIRIVEVYIILMSESQFVLLDEPFSHISPHRVEVLGALIAAEKKKKGIVITDHYYRTVMGLSDKLYLLRDGTMYPVDGEEDLIQNGYLPDRN